MKQFQSRLTISLGFLILIVIICLSFLIGQFLKTFYKNQFEDRLLDKSQYISSLIKEEESIDKITKKRLTQLSDLFKVDIFLIKDRKLTFESDKFISLNKKSREKVVDWASTYNSKSSLLIITQNQQEIYFQNAPIIKDNRLEGYLVISKDDSELNKTYKKMTRLLIVSFLLSFFIIIFYSTIILRRSLSSLNLVTKTITELEKGNFYPRIDDYQKVTQNKLTKSVERLVSNLQDLVEKQRIQQEHLSTLVENIGSGLIFIDGHGFINFINRPYKQIFQVGFNNYKNEPYYNIIKFDEINDLVEEIFMTEQNVRRQLTLPLGIERRHFEVYGAPIIGENSSWKGILLVFHDITELKKLEKTRKDFVANVSHELKTPITSIKGFSETLLDGASEDEEALQLFLSIILKESNRLQSLLQDLLDLSKIEEDDFKLNIQKFDIVSLLNEITTLLNKKASEKNITLNLTHTNEKIFINADLDRIKQLFINLINNAIAYTHEGGTVTINIAQSNKDVVISVADTGIGIENEEIPRIFERFYRVDRARSRDSGGTGLGLAIVKHIVEAHDGKITVKSVLSKGTTFTISMPKKQMKELY